MVFIYLAENMDWGLVVIDTVKWYWLRKAMGQPRHGLGVDMDRLVWQGLRAVQRKC